MRRLYVDPVGVLGAHMSSSEVNSRSRLLQENLQTSSNTSVYTWTQCEEGSSYQSIAKEIRVGGDESREVHRVAERICLGGPPIGRMRKHKSTGLPQSHEDGFAVGGRVSKPRASTGRAGKG